MPKNMETPELRTAGLRPQRTDLKDMPARLIATYAPGTNPQSAPEGTAFRLDAGGIIELQMHYTTNGKAGNGSHKDRHHVCEGAGIARGQGSALLQRHVEAAGTRGRRRSEHRSRVSAGCDRVGTLPAHPFARQEMGIRAPDAEWRDQTHPCRAAIRLQLADLLHVQGAAAGAEGIEDRLDGVVRQLTRRTRTIRTRTSTCCGAIRRGKRCSTREYS